VNGLAKIAAPLISLFRKGESTQLGALNEDQLLAFDTLKQCLISPAILAFPKANGQFNLETDASSAQICCCLFQAQSDGKLHPLGYWSHGLTSAERNYSTTENEFLATVWAILTLRSYLEGKRFIIRTDHLDLRWVLNLADAQGRLARWRIRIQKFDYKVQYLPGRSHHRAYMMSRLQSTDPSLCDPDSPVDTDIPCCFLFPIGMTRHCYQSMTFANINGATQPIRRSFPIRVVASLWTWMITE
jgi:RNase H-like domain found in reverse transcriptase